MAGDDTREQLAFELNHYDIDDPDSNNSGSGMLLNAMHCEARFGALPSTLLMQHPAYQQADTSIMQSVGTAVAALAKRRIDVARSSISAESAGRLFGHARNASPPPPPAAPAAAVDAPAAAPPPDTISSASPRRKRAWPDEAQHPRPGDAGGYHSEDNRASPFVTARHQMRLDSIRRNGGGDGGGGISSSSSDGCRPVAAAPHVPRIKRFVPPVRRTPSADAAADGDGERAANPADPYALASSAAAGALASRLAGQRPGGGAGRRALAPLHAKRPAAEGEPAADERLRNIEPRM
ncbi:hypothetical protein LPJ53_005491, partial [Coemansia erecta]